MKFVKFPSLTNTYQEKFINKIQLLDVEIWTVTEKIHGANMGIYCDGNDIKVASRNQIVGLDFFNCGPVINKYKNDILTLWENLNKPKYMIVYGEFFGGLYNGKSGDTAKKVQKGVNYHYENDFLAFNALCVESGKSDVWYDTAVLNSTLTNHKLSTVPILFTGSLMECLQYKNDYDSVVPKMYELPSESNVCEGNVIMPANGCDYVKDGIFLGLKNKNSKWSEKSKAPKLPVEVNEEVTKLTEILCSYCTKNRFSNVMSKEGEFDKKQIGKYLGLLQKDCWEDYLSDGNLVPSEKHEKKYMSSQLTNVARPIVLSEM